MKKKTIVLSSLLILVFIVGIVIFREKNSAPQGASTAILTADQTTAAQNLVKSNNFKGNATIYEDGQKVWESTTANTANSAYLINSIQKVFTAGLVMQQVDQGRLALNTKVAQFYPNIPNAGNETVMNLLEMTSGYTSSAPIMGTVPYQNDDVNGEDLAKKIKFDQTKFGQWNYQDVNYALLSHIIEKTSGQSYENLFNAMYTTPLGLKHTGFMWADDQTKQNIQLAQPTTNVDMNAVHGLLGAGSVAMSNEDLFLASRALLNGKLLSNDSRVAIYGTGNNQVHYRGGFYDKGNYYYCNGGGYNYSSFLRISKDGKNAVILQTNMGGNFGQISNQANQLYEKLFE